MTDRAIIALYQARDEQALAETHRTYGNYCMSIAMGILGRRADAEECVNDTLLRAWQTIPPKDPPSLKLYLGRIIRNLAISRYRTRRRQKRNDLLEIPLGELEACLPADGDMADSAALADLLNTFVARLSTLDRRLFVGRYWYNYDLATLGQAYGLTAGAVSLRLMRTREALRDYLEKEDIHP